MTRSNALRRLDLLSVGVVMGIANVYLDFVLRHLTNDLRVCGVRLSLFVAIATVLMVGLGSSEPFTGGRASEKWVRFVVRARWWIFGYWTFMLGCAGVVGLYGYLRDGVFANLWF